MNQKDLFRQLAVAEEIFDAEQRCGCCTGDHLTEGIMRGFLKCRYCGCTEHTPCGTDDGPCYWVVQPTRKQGGVCSASKCVLAFDREKKRARREAATAVAHGG